jgi:hypothetical protein
MCQATNQLADHTYFDFSDDCCPVHGSEVKKEYDFGMGDATVYTFRGCCCAVGYDSERGFYKGSCYFTNYNQASGYARLVAAGNAVR